MYQNLKIVVGALAIAAGGLLFGLAGSEFASPPQVAGLDGETHLASDAQPAEASAGNRRGNGLKRHLAMPFISFSPLLPRRGS